MKKIVSTILAVIMVGTAYGGDMGTPEEAKAMSLKAQAAVNEMGRDKSFAVFTDKNGGFREKDLYVFWALLHKWNEGQKIPNVVKS